MSINEMNNIDGWVTAKDIGYEGHKFLCSVLKHS